MNEPLKNNNSFGTVIWLTGLSGAGKSTLARGLYLYYQSKDLRVECLDGDHMRAFFPQTGFSKEARDENVRRAGLIASLLERHGVITIAAFISPYLDTRQEVRGMCRRFIEVYVETPLEECERRDPKGLYKKVRAGLISHFTGISDPYEPPSSPEIIIRTEGCSIEESINKLINAVEQLRTYS